MLGGSADAFALYTVDVCGGNQTAQHRVFGEILEVSAVEGIAEYVHAWGEDDVVPHVEGFFSDPFTYSAGHGPVPTGCGKQTCGEAGRLVVVKAYAHRTIHHYD